ncbi:MAG: hypothetical protein ACLTR8_03420 [Oscillospiraceae bacterium]
MYLISSANLRKAKGAAGQYRPLLYKNIQNHCPHSPPLSGAGTRFLRPAPRRGHTGAEGGLYRGHR